jgi:hypothetical protein
MCSQNISVRHCIRLRRKFVPKSVVGAWSFDFFFVFPLRCRHVNYTLGDLNRARTRLKTAAIARSSLNNSHNRCIHAEKTADVRVRSRMSDFRRTFAFNLYN